ncbi:AAA family ATPase [Cellulosilyticum lentocellum]|uniref:ATPase associated with various cellular activities AAA_3 n=1 Tax=Cellulosilyticum lentocellum (strain ATCC 49066 / DSM 5427 / NCIMB 11756 / RHM5) TaxID=642492 RepID=F2JH93_CELLD|nr:MoxR family ATPase [Cellulosilyticum lentocellum]ADZ82991.1 ATPase associated with various cellular activities AAA_3 [Cellulosilyticum lentocellum DSM 5427]
MEKQGLVHKMLEHMEQVIIGKREVLELVIVALISEGHILLEDVPGVGKTTLANALAHTIHSGFSRIQFTPDTLPSDITGMTIYNMQNGQFELVKGQIMNHIILADEINRTSPKTQASLLEAMEERQVTVDGKSYQLPQPFMVIATQNPIDYLGTYNLPEAQLDRFLMKISIGYPDKKSEIKMVQAFLEDSNWKQIDYVVEEADIIAMIKEVQLVKVHPDLIDYLLRLVEETRNNSAINLGASPRATLALSRSSQALAYMNGRDFVIPDDIRKMVIPVLAHRLVLSSEAKLNKQTPEKLLKVILSKIKQPTL